MKKKTFSVLAIAIWLICAVSLAGVYFYRKRVPHTPEYMVKGWAIISNRSAEERENIARFDSSMLRLSDESFRLVGMGHDAEEGNLIKDNKISSRKINFQITDRLLLERQFMINQAFKTLNNAEKRCLQDRFATIIYRDGDYFLYVDSKKYQEYVLKYGTECKECGQAAK